MRYSAQSITRTISALTATQLPTGMTGWREAIISSVLLRDNKCNNWDSNPNSSEQKHQNLLCSYPLRHDTQNVQTKHQNLQINVQKKLKLPIQDQFLFINTIQTQINHLKIKNRKTFWYKRFLIKLFLATLYKCSHLIVSTNWACGKSRLYKMTFPTHHLCHSREMFYQYLS